MGDITVAVAVAKAERKVHNKSGQTGLAILDHSAAVLESYRAALVEAKSTWRPNPSGLVSCRVLDAMDGRITVSSKKLYGYHLVALDKFGRERLAQVSSSKSEPGAITISHLCGTENMRCVTPAHIELVTKKVNDERHIHHSAMRDAFVKGGGDQKAARLVRDLICSHVPLCD